MKNIILTGASDGLGKQIAKTCIQENINIIALCRSKPNYDCIFLETDLSNEMSMQNTCNIIKNKYSKFDALINCAGVPGIQKINEITYSCLENLMKINSIAPMFLTSQLIDLIKNIASQKFEEMNRKLVIYITPNMKELYKNRDTYFDKENYQLLSEEVWQVFTDFDNLENIKYYG